MTCVRVCPWTGTWNACGVVLCGGRGFSTGCVVYPAAPNADPFPRNGRAPDLDPGRAQICSVEIFNPLERNACCVLQDIKRQARSFLQVSLELLNKQFSFFPTKGSVNFHDCFKSFHFPTTKEPPFDAT